MTSQQVVTNAVRKTTLISRHGLALRVTDNAVNGSESVTGDANSKYKLICLTSKQTLSSIMDGISPRAGCFGVTGTNFSQQAVSILLLFDTFNSNKSTDFYKSS